MIERWSEGVAADSMAEEILVDLADLIRRHPWWQARARLTLNLLARLGIRPPAQILDAGCGWGVTLEALEGRGYQAIGLDISGRTLDQLDRPHRRLIEADLARPIDRADADLRRGAGPGCDRTRRRRSRCDRPARFPCAAGWRPDRQCSRAARALQRVRCHPGPSPARTSRKPSSRRSRARAWSWSDTFWWGRWLVPTLRHHRGRPRSRPGETPSEIYRHYLELPPWPLPWAARLAFLIEQPLALGGLLSTGTSLFAVARRGSGYTTSQRLDESKS